jgi:hypothetical protein
MRRSQAVCSTAGRSSTASLESRFATTLRIINFEKNRGVKNGEKSLRNKTEAPQSFRETQGLEAHRREHGQNQTARTRFERATVGRLPQASLHYHLNAIPNTAVSALFGYPQCGAAPSLVLVSKAQVALARRYIVFARVQ